MFQFGQIKHGQDDSNNQTVAVYVDSQSQGRCYLFCPSYYMLDGNELILPETTATVPESQVTGKLTITNQTSNGFDGS